jgi:hypothetical protein
VLRHMLQHAQRNMHVMFDDQQALNHQLLRVSDAPCFSATPVNVFSNHYLRSCLILQIALCCSCSCHAPLSHETLRVTAIILRDA